MMKFEVKLNSITKFSTTYESCIPDKETRAAMRKAGYKLFKDGKVYKE